MHEDVAPLNHRTSDQTAGPVPAAEAPPQVTPEVTPEVTPGAASEPLQPPGAAAPETDNPAVDEVLWSLDQLGSRPLSEHVAVFESAHERLRAALSEAGDAGAGPGHS